MPFALHTWMHTEFQFNKREILKKKKPPRREPNVCSVITLYHGLGQGGTEDERY